MTDLTEDEGIQVVRMNLSELIGEDSADNLIDALDRTMRMQAARHKLRPIITRIVDTLYKAGEVDDNAPEELTFKTADIRTLLGATLAHYFPDIEQAVTDRAGGHAIKDTACPVCGVRLNAAAVMNAPDSIKPRPGMHNLCVTCGSLSRFDDEMNLQTVSDEDFDKLPDEARSEVRRLRRLLGEADAKGITDPSERAAYMREH